MRKPNCERDLLQPEALAGAPTDVTFKRPCPRAFSGPSHSCGDGAGDSAQQDFGPAAACRAVLAGDGSSPGCINQQINNERFAVSTQWLPANGAGAPCEMEMTPLEELIPPMSPDG